MWYHSKDKEKENTHTHQQQQTTQIKSNQISPWTHDIHLDNQQIHKPAQKDRNLLEHRAANREKGFCWTYPFVLLKSNYIHKCGTELFSLSLSLYLIASLISTCCLVISSYIISKHNKCPQSFWKLTGFVIKTNDALGPCHLHMDGLHKLNNHPSVLTVLPQPSAQKCN